MQIVFSRPMAGDASGFHIALGIDWLGRIQKTETCGIYVERPFYNFRPTYVLTSKPGSMSVDQACVTTTHRLRSIYRSRRGGGQRRKRWHESAVVWLPMENQAVNPKQRRPTMQAQCVDLQPPLPDYRSSYRVLSLFLCRLNVNSCLDFYTAIHLLWHSRK